MKVVIPPAAESDVAATAEYLVAAASADDAARFVAAFRRAVAAIRANPRTYPPTDDGPDGVETREYFIQRYQHRVIYMIANNRATIMSVIHARRRPGVWVSRLPNSLDS